MTDIVERLRNRLSLKACFRPTHLHAPDWGKGSDWLNEAADEIERLRALTSPQLHQHGLPADPPLDLLGAMWNAMFETPFDGTQAPMMGAGYDALRAALAQQPLSVPAWQPIETAPKDGTVILLCGGAYHGHPFSGKWDLGPFGDTERPWLNVINDSRLYGHVPKKWMPLTDAQTPAAPTEGERA